MENFESSLIEAFTTKSFLLSYFKFSNFRSFLIDKQLKDNLSKFSCLEDSYSCLLKELSSNPNFKSIPYLSLEFLILSIDQKSQSKSKLSRALGIILNTDESGITLKHATNYITSLHNQYSQAQFDYFIVQLLYWRPNLFEDLANEDKIILKRIICRAFEDKVEFSEREQYHILINNFEEMLNKQWEYFQKEMIRYSKLRTFIDLKKNRPNLFTFLKNITQPVISQYDTLQINRLISSINSIIKDHPETDDSNYYDYYSNVIKRIDALIKENELNITFFGAVSYLPLLNLVLQILENEHSLITENLRCEVYYVKPDKKYPLKSKTYFDLDIPIYYHSGNSQARDIYINLRSSSQSLQIDPQSQFCSYLDNSTHHREYISKFKILPLRDIENETELVVSLTWKSIFGKSIKKDGKIVLKRY